MINKTQIYPKIKFSSKKTSIRKKLGFSIFLITVIIITIILFHSIISLLIYESKIEITTSELQNNEEISNNFLQVSINVVLYNPGRQQGTTVWVEITDQSTDVSFSKTKYVNLDFREQKNLTFNFMIDKMIYHGEFSHRTWLTFPDSQD